MGESAAVSADGDGSSDSTTADGRKVINVADEGDIILDVTFETSREILKKHRNAAAAAARRTKAQDGQQTNLSPRTQVAYRVNVEVLKRHSKYFYNLLSNPQFREASLITNTLAKLASMKIMAGEAIPDDLPWISIADDDEATKAAGREVAFEDMLRILHRKLPKTARPTMSYATTIAVIADRFDCVSAVARSLNTELKFKWPVTNTKPLVDENGKMTDAEQVLRQKVLVSWLLGQPMRLGNASRELIIRGSSVWGAYHDQDTAKTAAWWNLPDGLEAELQYRRECILNTIASVQRHFLARYSSRQRQCKLGYDSSAACDSFQLGQMLKFLVSRDLLFLVDYSQASVDSLPDMSLLDIEALLSTLRQCPNYQIDKHHTNCGLRIRIEPILDYIRAMLSANTVSISLTDWKRGLEGVAWPRPTTGDGFVEDDKKTFAFTRAVANDQRLRFEGGLYTDKMAKQLFTAEAWDWTPEY